MTYISITGKHLLGGNGMKKLEGIISKTREHDLVKDRNRIMRLQYFKFYSLTLIWILAIIGAMAFCSMLNYQMVIPRIGHHVAVDIILYAFIAYTAFAATYNIYRYHKILQHNLNVARLKYTQPIIKSYAKRFAYWMAYGLDFICLEDAGKYY